MNKKGFTLIEILSSITLLSLLATFASVNIVKFFDNNTLKKQLNEDNLLTSAACIYIELKDNLDLKNICLNYGCDIKSDVLIKKGLINEEDISKLKIIHIYKDNNEKKCIVK